MRRMRQTGIQVGVIGGGAVGTVVSDALRAGCVARATLAGMVTGHNAPQDDFQALLETCDVIVEAASQAAVADYGPQVKDAGIDLVVVSVGALADDALLRKLSAPSGGRLLISTGACGGIDLLRAAHLLRPLDEVRLRTTKASAALIRDWMTSDMRQRLIAGRERVSVFTGSAREAVRLFPETANIAALIALSTVGFEAAAVEIRADPTRTQALHEVSAQGEAGTYRFVIENALSDRNPKTSAVTAYSVLRGLSDISTAFVTGW